MNKKRIDLSWKGVKIVNPKQFLQIGGAVLILIAILGFIGVIGPTAQKSLFGPTWWFDNGENWAHLILGIVGVAAAYVFPGSAQKPLVMLLGIIGILVGLYSAVISPSFFGANLENPADTLLHLAVGAWALWASMAKSGMSSGQTMMPGQM